MNSRWPKPSESKRRRPTPESYAGYESPEPCPSAGGNRKAGSVVGTTDHIRRDVTNKEEEATFNNRLAPARQPFMHAVVMKLSAWPYLLVFARDSPAVSVPRLEIGYCGPTPSLTARAGARFSRRTPRSSASEPRTCPDRGIIRHQALFRTTSDASWSTKGIEVSNARLELQRKKTSLPLLERLQARLSSGASRGELKHLSGGHGGTKEKAQPGQDQHREQTLPQRTS
jgi:hypothetical protein